MGGHAVFVFVYLPLDDEVQFHSGRSKTAGTSAR